MKKNKISLLLVLTLATSLTAYADDKPDIKEGLWEINYQTFMQGMTMPVLTVKQCLTGTNAVPEQPNENNDCKIIKTAFNANTVSWKVDCSTTKGSGKITYSGDSMKGNMNITAESGGMKMEMKNKISGRWIGACKD